MHKRVFSIPSALCARRQRDRPCARHDPDQVPARLALRGPAALFLVPAAKGYFKDAKLDVAIDAGTGSGAAVQRVASGTYDMGFADLAALMEFRANNPMRTSRWR